ncbi:NifB/NifX family molybdenum-iron cluster-binding protein, partial [Candidatus Woesearchaeota archaeon]|nr:NifB/NifX family molybdenum-iron cluster-binding protein [Candidatus Woesearchaeota archaeon]
MNKNMKLAISASGNSLESEVDMRFGRCPYFIFVELEGKEIKSTEIVANASANQTGGVGITSAELVAKKGVGAVLTGNVGPRAFSVFSQFNIAVYQV